MSRPGPDAGLGSPPYVALRLRLLDLAGTIEGEGEPEASRALREVVGAWWEEQQRWNQGLAGRLGVHHEINNALVGVRGNAQLLLMGPMGQEPALKERLEIVIRESVRIKEAASRLRELKSALGGSDQTSRAA